MQSKTDIRLEKNQANTVYTNQNQETSLARAYQHFHPQAISQF